ncbi:MAG: DUF4363 family protein [Firmicutes bacterium]|jgi:hypothetical protein|nr:DUF4363 family protein [Bacillota bacterium]
MKVLIATILLVITIICAGIMGQRYLTTTREELYDALAEVEAALLSDDWALSEARVRKLQDSWNRIHHKWALLISQTETERLELAIVRLASRVKTREKGEALTEIAVGRSLLHATIEKELLSLLNLL